MRVVICWAGISGYLAACWRALAKVQGISFQIVTYGHSKSDDAPFDTSILEGIPYHLLKAGRASDAREVAEVVAGLAPDIVALPGWIRPSYCQLVHNPALRSAKFVMEMDTPWLGSWQQYVARFKLRRYLSRLDAVVVTGERCWQYARHLGIPESKIYRGTYGVDYDGLAPTYTQRVNGGPWPRRFLFVGRYAPVKGIDVLLEAYGRYRSMVSDPWPLSCCGGGPLAERIQSAEGVENLGFVQPGDLPGVFARHGAFVLASRFDPWPLVVVESCAAGLPVLCTEACGSAVELVRSHFNGMTVATGDARALARGMAWMHENHARLPEMGARSQQLAAAYSAQRWADRWAYAFNSILG